MVRVVTGIYPAPDAREMRSGAARHNGGVSFMPTRRPGLCVDPAKLEYYLMSDIQSNEEKLKAFLFRFFQGYSLKNDENIFNLGFVNSLFALQLVTFVEKEFGITIEDEDLEPENFQSINALLYLIERKKAGLSHVH